MNALEMLASGPLLDRLGWTLVHFLWQGLSIAILYAATRQAVSRIAGPHLRYLLACAALAAMMAAPLVTWELMGPPEIAIDAAGHIRSSAPVSSPSGPVTATNISLPESVRVAMPGVDPAEFLRWVVMVWLAGAVAFWVRLAGGWVVAARMRSMLVRSAPPEWRDTFEKLRARIGVSRPVKLLVSALVQVPTVIGWPRPVVLVPVGALGGLPAEHLEALLLHELAHIRRHDYLVNLLQSVAEALLFYHPAVWWVSGHIRAEREQCCDDLVVAVSGDALTYARALAQLESCRPAYGFAALAADGGSLADRISRLLGQPRRSVRAGLGPGVLAVAMLLVAASYGLFAQQDAHPAFQSVTIKRNASNWSERFEHPMGMSENASLMLLIRFAYATHDSPYLGHSLTLPTSQVAGGPAWIDSEGYDIEAKAAPNSDPKQQWPMWQNLLADRFKLKLHRETRDLPVYVLTAAKSGLKLPPAKDLGCVHFLPGEKPHRVAGKVDCGYVSGPFSEFEPGRLNIRGSKVHMADLIRELSNILDRPVLDKTGFTGEFDVKLSFTADDTLISPFKPVGSKLPADPNFPNLFAALEGQLGLKLDSATGPVEVLVIDRAERPAVN